MYTAVLSSQTCSFLFCSTMYIAADADEAEVEAIFLFCSTHVDADGVGWQWFTCNGCCRWCWMINEVEVEGRYCDGCYVCWRDWHEAVAWRETAWADTADCMVMLATRSVQDNPHAVP